MTRDRDRARSPRPADWSAPTIDWHALAPELVLDRRHQRRARHRPAGRRVEEVGDGDAHRLRPARRVHPDRHARRRSATTCARCSTAATSSTTSRSSSRRCSCSTAYVVVLMSQTELEEGGYYQGEFYVLLLVQRARHGDDGVEPRPRQRVRRPRAAVDPRLHARRLAQARPQEQRGRRQVLPARRVRQRRAAVRDEPAVRRHRHDASWPTSAPRSADGDLHRRSRSSAIVFVIAGFGFKVSAVPFHTWAPDTYEGAPTPVTAFLSVASKAAGFVALILVIFLAFPTADDVYGPLIWVLAALTMTVGNVLALRQTNIVRMLAYSSVSQGGFILMPLAFVGTGDAGAIGAARPSSSTCSIYAFTNLGAFAVVIAVSPQDPQRRDLLVRRADQLRPGPGRADDDLPRLARRRPAARRLDRQVQRRSGPCSTPARRGAYVAGRDRRRQHRDRRRLLHAGDARDVDERPVPDGDTTPIVTPPPVVGGARHHRRRHDRRSACCPASCMRFADLQDLTGALGG